MSCPHSEGKAATVINEQGASPVLPNWQIAIEQQMNKIESSSASEKSFWTNSLLDKIAKIKQENSEGAEAPKTEKIKKFLASLPPTVSIFQAYYQALGDSSFPELSSAPVLFTMALKFSEQIPETLFDLRGNEPLGKDNENFEGQNFCDSILAVQKKSPVQKLIDEDFNRLVLGKSVSNWHNLYRVYPFYWLTRNKNGYHKEVIAKFLPFLGVCPREIAAAQKKMAAPDLSSEQKNTLTNKINFYREIVDLTGIIAQSSDLEIIACLKNFLNSPEISPEEKKHYNEILATIIDQ